MLVARNLRSRDHWHRCSRWFVVIARPIIWSLGRPRLNCRIATWHKSGGSRHEINNNRTEKEGIPRYIYISVYPSIDRRAHVYPAFIIRRTLYIYIRVSVIYRWIAFFRVTNGIRIRWGQTREMRARLKRDLRFHLRRGEEEEVSLIRIGTKETSSAFTVG